MAKPPAGPDLQQMIARQQLQFSADPFVLSPRSLCQSCIWPFEVGAGIHHRLIEHKAEKLISQIVMGRDVFLAAHFRIAIEPVDGLEERLG